MRRPILAPRPRPDMGNLYLIGFVDGTIKIGQSANVRARLQTHKRAGGVIAWCHVFAACPKGTPLQLEYAALKEFEWMGERIGRAEKFSGISKADAIACVRRLICAHDKMVEQWAKKSVRRVTKPTKAAA